MLEPAAVEMLLTALLGLDSSNEKAVRNSCEAYLSVAELYIYYWYYCTLLKELVTRIRHRHYLHCLCGM